MIVSSSYTISALLAIPLAVTYIIISSRKVIHLHQNRSVGFIIAVFSIIFLVMYLKIPSLSPNVQSFQDIDLVKLLGFAAALISGGIFHGERVSVTTAILSGLLLTLLYIITLVHGAAKGIISFYKALPVSLILFAIMNAGIIAIGRWDFGLQTALSGRYTTFQVLGIIGAVMYWSVSAHDCAHGSSRNIKKPKVFLVRFLATVFISLIIISTCVELSIRPYRKTYFDGLDNAVLQKGRMSEEQKKLFNADDVSSVNKFVEILHNHNLGPSVFPRGK